ncbi:hypothetical protein Droror1_Dr00009492 [Drosera rotundifolia]
MPSPSTAAASTTSNLLYGQLFILPTPHPRRPSSPSILLSMPRLIHRELFAGEITISKGAILRSLRICFRCNEQRKNDKQRSFGTELPFYDANNLELTHP